MDGESQARRRQTERTRARMHTRARASTHTNADIMSVTMNCAACTPAGKSCQCQQQRHCARCRQRGHEYESHAKCAGAAADVTVVVRGRVVDDDVVDVNGVEGASVVVVAAAPPASSAPRARHCRGRFRRDIGRKNAAQADTGHVEGCCPWRRMHRRSSSSSGSRSHAVVASCKQQKMATTSHRQTTASKHKPPGSHQPWQRTAFAACVHSLKPAAPTYHRRRHHHRLAEACCRTATSAHTIGKWA